jgi:hypothetical protein
MRSAPSRRDRGGLRRRPPRQPLQAEWAHDAPLPMCLALTALLRDLSHLENLTMRSLTLAGAAMLATALLTGCDNAVDSMDPMSVTPGTPAFAAGQSIRIR